MDFSTTGQLSSGEDDRMANRRGTVMSRKDVASQALTGSDGMSKLLNDPIFRVEHLWLAHPGRRGSPATPILNDVSFTVERGRALTSWAPSRLWSSGPGAGSPPGSENASSCNTSRMTPSNRASPCRYFPPADGLILKTFHQGFSEPLPPRGPALPPPLRGRESRMRRPAPHGTDFDVGGRPPVGHSLNRWQ